MKNVLEIPSRNQIAFILSMCLHVSFESWTHSFREHLGEHPAYLSLPSANRSGASRVSLVWAAAAWRSQEQVPLVTNYFCNGLHRLSRENTIGPLLSPISTCVSMEATFLPFQFASVVLRMKIEIQSCCFWFLFLFPYFWSSAVCKLAGFHCVEPNRRPADFSLVWNQSWIYCPKELS